jgi:glycosyltransferase involved in cell wall biosynthesis
MTTQTSIWYRIYYSSASACIIQAHGPQPDLFALLKPKVYLLLSLSWELTDDTLAKLPGMFPTGYDTKKYVSILVNSTEEYTLAMQQGDKFNVYLWSNACKVLKPYLVPAIPNKSDTTRKYTAAMTSRLTKFKKHFLTYGIPHLAYITSPDTSPSVPGCSCPSNKLCYKCAFTAVPLSQLQAGLGTGSDIYSNVNAETIVSVLDNSQMGLILSSREGACYASLEYLCRGLPVVTTNSKGGRDVFYDDTNSIICDDNPTSLTTAINSAVQKLKSGAFNRETIRQSTLTKVRKYRQIFVDITTSIFSDAGVTDVDAFKYFKGKLEDLTFYPQSDVSAELTKIKATIGTVAS